MNVFIKSIRKLMGWCPNVTAPEIRSQTSAADFEAYDQSGGEKARNPKIPSQYSRLYVQILSQTLLFTFLPITYLLSQKGVNAEVFLIGLSISLPIYLLGWKKQMYQYDTLERNPVVFSSFKKTFYYIFLFLVLDLILLLLFLPYFLPHTPYLLSTQILNSFAAGTLVLMWGFYFQLIYWEKKNQMKIYVKNEKGLQRLYTAREKEEKCEY